MPSGGLEAFRNCVISAGNKWMHFMRPLPLIQGLSHKTSTFHFKSFHVTINWFAAVSLFFGCLGMAVAASIYSFFAWQLAMRAILDLSETDANLVATLGNLGMNLGFPAGMCYEFFGNQMAALISLFMFSTSYIFLWLGTGAWKDSWTGQAWIVDILYFMVGFGGSFAYMAALLPNIENFPFEQRGKVIGLLDASFSVGPTVLSLLYNSAFTNGYVTDHMELQNLTGYFLTLAITSIIVTLCLFLLVGKIKRHPHHDTPSAVTETSPVLQHDVSGKTGHLKDAENGSLSRDESVNNDEEGDDEEKIIGHVDYNAAVEDKPPNDFSEYPFRERPITQVIFQWNFWFLLTQYVLNACLQLTYQNNISTYLNSFGMNEYATLFQVLNTTLQIVSKFVAGIISDIIAHYNKFPRSVVFLVPYSLQTFFLILSMWYGNNFVVMLFTCIFVGVANGVTWCQTPTLIGELFGAKYMGSNWGWAMVFTAAMGFPFSIGFSSIYEAYIVNPGIDKDCFGLQCFEWSFFLLGGTSFATLIMVLGLTQNMMRNAAIRRLDMASRRPANTL